MRCALLTGSLFLATALCSAQVGDATAAVHEISPTELAAYVKTGTAHVYDCNEVDMHAEAHVPGATLVVYDALTVEQLPADKGAMLVFYCYSPECPAGGMAARTAVGLGYTNVHSMSAGIVGWQDAGLPTEP